MGLRTNNNNDNSNIDHQYSVCFLWARPVPCTLCVSIHTTSPEGHCHQFLDEEQGWKSNSPKAAGWSEVSQNLHSHLYSFFTGKHTLRCTAVYTQCAQSTRCLRVVLFSQSSGPLSDYSHPLHFCPFLLHFSLIPHHLFHVQPLAVWRVGVWHRRTYGTVSEPRPTVIKRL